MKFQPRVVIVLWLGTISALFCHGTSPGNVVGGGGGGGYQYQPQQLQQQQWNQEQQQQQYAQYGAHVDEHPLTMTQDIPEDNGLPEGWVEYMDQSSGRPYYYNENDGTTTWDKPVKEPTVPTQPESIETSVEQDIQQAIGTNDDDIQELKLEEIAVNPSYFQGYQMSQDPEENSQKEAQPEDTPESEPGPESKPQIYGQPQQWQQDPEFQKQQEAQPQPWGVIPQHDNPIPPWGVHPGSQPHPQGQQSTSWSKSPEDAPKRMEPEPEPMKDSPLVTFSSPTQGCPPLQQQQQQHGDSPQQPPQFAREQFDRPPQQQTPPFQQPPQREQYNRPPQQQMHTFQQPPQQEQLYRPPQQQGPPSRQQHVPPVRQFGGPQQGPPPGYQQHPQQQGVSTQEQRSPWQQGPPQEPIQQGMPPQQQQQPPYGQQYGQYRQPGNQYGGAQYPGQYGQYGQQRVPQQPPQNQLIPSETTSAVRDALGKTWQGLLGFGNRTKEVVEQARESVVTSATVAGQTIGSTTTGLWSQAKTGVGALFEKSDTPLQQPQGGYSMSGNYGVPPQQPGGYPPQQYGGYPPQYGQPQPRGVPPYPHQGQQTQQIPPQQAQWRGAPQQGGPPGQQQQFPTRGGPHGYPPQQYLNQQGIQQPPQQVALPQGQRPLQGSPPPSQPENWQHPGLGGDY